MASVRPACFAQAIGAGTKQGCADGHGTGREAAAQQIEAAKGVPGVLGMIYGPWAHDAAPGDPDLGNGDYTALESYAMTARQMWPKQRQR